MQNSIIRKSLVVGIIFLFIGIAVAPSVTSKSELINNNVFENNNSQSTPIVGGKTIYVDDDNTGGPWNGTLEHPFQNINDGIDYAIDGDTVFVFNGTYNESVNIDKSINVIGEDKNITIIDGQKKRANVVRLKANGITISGFSVIRSKDWANDVGMLILSSYNTVKDNIIANNFGGEGGIFIDGDYNEIINNIIINNQRIYSDGIFISYKAHYNVISGNTIEQNNRGMRIHATKNNIIVNNNISNNAHKGIWITMGENNEVSNNRIENNSEAGIEIERDASNFFIYDNIIKNNDKGLIINDAVSIKVVGNSFKKSGIQLLGNKLNHWNTHEIKNNQLNGKPIVYYKNDNNVVIPSNAAQVILANCLNSDVVNLNITNLQFGIQIAFSEYIRINFNYIDNCYSSAIKCHSSNYLTIKENIIQNNLENGIIISGDSTNSTIEKNNITQNQNGINIGSGSTLNTIEKNNITQNQNGINIGSGSSLNTIRYNHIQENNEYGINLKGSENNIYLNNFEQNKIGFYLYLGYNNLIFKNNFIKNSQSPATFRVDYKRPRDNVWDKNFYDNTHWYFIKIIWGRIRTRYYWEDPYTGEKDYFYRTGLNFDWHPALEPYDIPGSSNFVGCGIK